MSLLLDLGIFALGYLVGGFTCSMVLVSYIVAAEPDGSHRNG